MYIVKIQQTEVINIKCYHDNLHTCKRINHEYPKISFFYVTFRMRHLSGSSSTQSMYYRQKMHIFSYISLFSLCLFSMNTMFSYIENFYFL